MKSGFDPVFVCLLIYCKLMRRTLQRCVLDDDSADKDGPEHERDHRPTNILQRLAVQDYGYTDLDIELAVCREQRSFGCDVATYTSFTSAATLLQALLNCCAVQMQLASDKNR